MKTLLPCSSLEFAHTYLVGAFLLICCVADAQPKKNIAVKGYGSASYSVTASGQYMRDWLIAGPVVDVVDKSENGQKKIFENDDVNMIAVDRQKTLAAFSKNAQLYKWHLYSSKDDVINLEDIFKSDFAAAYALAEIKADQAQKVFLSLGSDDAARVWLNGKIVHDNWILRGVRADEDLVPLELVKGSNQLLLKIQDMEQGWGFIARILDRKGLAERLAPAITHGNLDEAKLLVEAGADLSHKNKVGMTPLNFAQLSGRGDIEKYLIEKGAIATAFPTPEILVDNEYSALQGKKAAGISILVAKDGKIVYGKGFGYGNIEKNEPVTLETKFRIGSITKQFIGAAILKLQEDGKLSVEDKLSKYVTDFPRGDEVTIHHLLTHTSGIHSYTGRADFLSRVTSPVTEDEVINIIKSDPYDFNPGEQFLYNNSGYFLLGHIIRKVTGKFYGDYLSEVFFAPLEMTNTGVYTKSLKLSREALGYKKEANEYKADLDWDMTWAGGAGSLYSTAIDLYKWNEALFNGKVLKAESMKAAFTPVLLNNGETPVGGKYGYGWGMETYRGQDVIAHGGGLHGFSTRIARLPKQNMTIVMLTNVIPTEVNLSPVAIAEFYLWDKMEKQSSQSVVTVTEDVGPYVGRYDFTNGMVMAVTREGNNLFAQLTGQQRFPIFPSGDGKYFWRVVDAKINFVKNEKGEVTHGDFSQNGGTMKVLKLSDEPVATIDPTVLNDYVGKYDYGNNIFVVVTNENGRLFAQGTNQPKFEFFPSSNVEFFGRDINARLTFVKDKPGKASKIILNMGGQKREMPRVE